MPSSFVIWTLRVTCFLTFVGHGWVCLNGNMPIRALLWDEELMTGVVESWLGMNWGEYVSSLEIADRIDGFVRIQGWVFLFFGLCCLIPLRKWCGSIYLVGAVNLGLLAWLKYLDGGTGIGMLLEHASQFCIPVILYFALYSGKGWCGGTNLIAKVSIALTFVFHGFFAIGFYSDITWFSHPMPQSFPEMTMACLNLESETAAERILLVAGIVDIVAAILIFVPAFPQWIPLGYMIVWGFLTALARPWSHPDSLDAWVPEMLYRAPHFGLPLILLFLVRKPGPPEVDSLNQPNDP